MTPIVRILLLSQMSKWPTVGLKMAHCFLLGLANQYCQRMAIRTLSSFLNRGEEVLQNHEVFHPLAEHVLL